MTATDIGALPDRSVTEALQRVPGVAISRFAGTNDPDHWSRDRASTSAASTSSVRNSTVATHFRQVSAVSRSISATCPPNCSARSRCTRMPPPS
ncbi:hypothetical protein ACU5AX_15000 [Sphingomonas sp. XXL09]|uniref:hypothetical protein n=1 Tax=Sphingomonas sp. XXL09 TaxID=3457787 RepID=UPI00406BA8B7